MISHPGLLDPSTAGSETLICERWQQDFFPQPLWFGDDLGNDTGASELLRSLSSPCLDC